MTTPLKLQSLTLISLVLTLAAALSTGVYAQTDSGKLLAGLLQSSGSDYVAARDKVLSLPTAELDVVLAQLNRAVPVSQERIIASILAFRRDHPAVAATFDRRFKNALENPDRTARHGEPRYILGWTKDDPDLGPIRFEAFLKLSFPDDAGGRALRASILENLHSSTPSAVDALLWIMTNRGMHHVHLLPRVMNGDPEQQERVTRFLVEAYKRWRPEGLTGTSTFSVLSSFGTRFQLDALRAIRAFEVEECRKEGSAPWDDDRAGDLLMAAMTDRNQAKQQLAQARIDVHAGRDPHANIAELERLVEERTRAVDAAQRRKHTKDVWDRLEQTIADLEARLRHQEDR
jgi:hypothetical protein